MITWHFIALCVRHPVPTEPSIGEFVGGIAIGRLLVAKMWDLLGHDGGPEGDARIFGSHGSATDFMGFWMTADRKRAFDILLEELEALQLLLYSQVGWFCPDEEYFRLVHAGVAAPSTLTTMPEFRAALKKLADDISYGK